MEYTLTIDGEDAARLRPLIRAMAERKNKYGDKLIERKVSQRYIIEAQKDEAILWWLWWNIGGRA